MTLKTVSSTPLRPDRALGRPERPTGSPRTPISRPWCPPRTYAARGACGGRSTMLIYCKSPDEILEIVRLTIEIAIAPFCSFIRSRTHFPPMLKVWVTEGIKKWFGPLRETPPSPPDKYSNWPPPPEILFMDTIKGKTEHSGQKGADHFFSSPLLLPGYPGTGHCTRVQYAYSMPVWVDPLGSGLTEKRVVHELLST